MSKKTNTEEKTDGMEIDVEVTKNPNLEIYDYIVLDRSYSMMEHRATTIKGVNEYIDQLKKDAEDTKQKTFVSILLFDHEMLPLFSYFPVAELRHITENDFIPRGSTALNDAIGHAIEDLKIKLKGREKSDDVDVTITVFTDGGENCSSKYPGLNNKQLQDYIKEIEQAYGWVVAKVGQGSQEDVVNTAKSAGFTASNVFAYSNNAEGFERAFSNMSAARSARTRMLSTGAEVSNVNYFAAPDETVEDSTPEVSPNGTTTGYLYRPLDNTQPMWYMNHITTTTPEAFSDDSGSSSCDSGSDGGGDGGGGD